MLTRAQRDRYLANGGVRCPFCDSTNTTEGAVDTDEAGFYQDCYCNDCYKSWVDVYKLIGVEDA